MKSNKSNVNSNLFKKSSNTILYSSKSNNHSKSQNKQYFASIIDSLTGEEKQTTQTEQHNYKTVTN